jgi:hypothetical protein
MPVKTANVEQLHDQTGNIYKSIVVLSKRARQIAANEKRELDEKLSYFEGFEEEDDFTFNEEQERISKEFEKRPHATRRAITEMEQDEVYFRSADEMAR